MTELWSWIDADGVAWSLDNFDAGIGVVQGVAGRGMPPIRRTRDTVAGVSGTRLRDTKHDMRVVTVPILLRSTTESGLATLLREWARRFDPVRGAGILDVATAIGTHRRLTCIYAQGLEIVENESSRFPGNQLAVLEFEADAPYWVDLADDSINFSLTTTAPVWFAGGSILPIELGADAFADGDVVTVDADVEVWPRWTITGPAAAVVIRNDTTGREFIWNGTLTGGQVLTIDTRPGVKTVQREDGSNQFGELIAWDLWPLRPGDNSITVSMSGSSGASAITAVWTNAHLTP